MKKRPIQPEPTETRKAAAHYRHPGLAVPALVFAGILVVAAVMRFSMLAAAPPGLCFDESMNGVNVMEAIESNSWKVFYPDNNGREGLFINIQGAFVKLQMQLSTASGAFRLEPWMLRFPSAVFGVLTVAGLYLLGLKMSSSRFLAAAAALFLATSFWHVNFSRIGFRAISAPFFLVWSLYFLFAGLSELGGDARRKGMLKLVVAGLLYGAGFHSYIAFRITPIVMVAAIVWLGRESWRTGRSRELLAGTGLFITCAIIAVAPLAIYFIEHPGSLGGRSSQVSALNADNPMQVLMKNTVKTALMFNVAGDSFWRHNISGRPQLFLPVGLLFLGGIVLTIQRAASREQRHSAFPGLLALIWLAAGAIPGIAANENVPHALRGLLMVPACCLLAGVAAERVWTWIGGRYPPAVAVACAGGIFVTLTWHCYSSYFGDYARSTQLREAFDVEWVELAREMNGVPATANKYVIAPGATLDHRGVPPHLYPLALVAGAHNAKARSESHVRFVVERAEAERVSKEEGAYIYLIQNK